MEFRRATWDDRDFLLRLRNDPETVGVCVINHPVDSIEHAEWLKKSLLNPNRRIYIAENNGLPVGVGRLDIDMMNAQISLTIAPEARGSRIGTRLVEFLLHEAKKEGIGCWAIVKEGNKPSVAIFRKLEVTTWFVS